MPRCGDGEAEARLEVGLLEDGEDPAGVGHLELAVEVDLLVDRVDEAVQPLAGAHVPGVGDDAQLVVVGEVGQGDAGPVPGGGVEVAPVEPDLVHGVGDEVDEGARPLAGGEGDGGPGGEDPFPAGEVEVDVVGLDIDQGRALGGLLAGEVLSGHGHSFCTTPAGGGGLRSILPRPVGATRLDSGATRVGSGRDGAVAAAGAAAHRPCPGAPRPVTWTVGATLRLDGAGASVPDAVDKEDA